MGRQLPACLAVPGPVDRPVLSPSYLQGGAPVRRTSWLFIVCATIAQSGAVAAELPKPVVTGLDHPVSIAVGTDRRVFVATLGDPGKQGTGAILVVKDGKAVPFAAGISARGLATWQQWLFTAETQRIWRIDPKGKAELFVPPEAFPGPMRSIVDL